MSSSRVIKAGVMRLLPKLEVSEEHSAQPAAAPAHVDSTDAADETDIEQLRTEAGTEFQAAYDELIETATNEVACMLEDARQEAQSIRQEAHREAEAAREEARQQGYEQGVSQGRSAAIEQTEQRFSALFAQGEAHIASIEAELRSHYEGLLDTMEQDVLRLSMTVAEKIIGSALVQDDEAFVSLVKTAIAAVKTESELSVRVNPEDFYRRFQAEAAIFDERRGAAVPVSPDPSVPGGGCLIDTVSGIADASPEAQLEQISYHLGLSPGEDK